jgi:hypothetical protein
MANKIDGTFMVFNGFSRTVFSDGSGEHGLSVTAPAAPVTFTMTQMPSAPFAVLSVNADPAATRLRQVATRRIVSASCRGFSQRAATFTVSVVVGA